MGYRSLLTSLDDNVTIQCKYVTDRSDNILGDGHFSVVKSCKNIYTDEIYAMKIVDKETIKGKLQLIKREISILQLVDKEIRNEEINENLQGKADTFDGHHHILQLFDFFETVESIVLITQLCDRSDLYEKIIENTHLDFSTQVIPYTACLLSAIDFLHVNGLIHRDIKAENILFRSKQTNALPIINKLAIEYDLTAHDLILGDFGLAVSTDSPSNSLKEYVGTISYISPEIVKCKNVSSMTPGQLDLVECYGTAVDIWAIGVLTYFMAFGYTPFDCESDDETLDCISSCDYYIDQDQLEDPELKDFWNYLQCCFEVEPASRPSSSDLKCHPLLNSFFPSFKDRASIVDFDNKLEKTNSQSSLHSLKSPIKTVSSTSLLTSNKKLDDIAKGRPSLSLSNKCSSTLNITHYTESRMVQSIKFRDSMKKTLSMTTLKHAHNAKPNNKKKTSTFQLVPNPPSFSLMNGCFSTSPRSQSRQSSVNSLMSLEGVSHSSYTSSANSGLGLMASQERKPVFQIGMDDDDED